MTSNDADAERVPGETPDRHEAFPRLTADQRDVLQTCGQRRTADVDDFLYRAGERVDEVLAVLSGRVAIVQSDSDADHIIVRFTDKDASSAS
jgi:CRP-like cAMP-binding protein